MAQALDPIDEACVLQRRLMYMRSPEMSARLAALCPEVERALARELDPERFAQGALSIFLPLALAGRLAELERLLGAALAMPTAPLTQAWLRVRVAELAQAAGQFDASMYHLGQLELERFTQDPYLQLAILYISGLTLRELGLIDRAIAACEQGIALAQQAQLYSPAAKLQNVLGGIYVRVGRQAEAIHIFELALHNIQKHGVEAIAESVESNLSGALLMDAQYARAAARYEAQRARLKRDAALDDLLICESNLASAYAALGRWEQAREAAQLAQALFAQGHWRGGAALWGLVLGLYALEHAQHHEARELLEQGIAAAQCEQRADLEHTIQLILFVMGALDGPAPPLTRCHMICEHHWLALSSQEAQMGDALPEPNAIEALCWRLLRDEDALGRIWFRRGSWDFSLDGQRWISLGRRGAARRLLGTLAQAHPEPVDAWALFERAWPDDKITSAQALNKLYTTIHRLRALGLAPHLVTVGDGYALRGQLILIEDGA